ncbi:unnamed protein product [Peronospora belbahrii]|uniref:Uncharacterized protein n=1 Tax=Peronospora belbahrii TaxID=622444 RepID=A0AAU9KQ49_9STRA|nr:unnamed protein product [Peronospora belbahrii]
MLFLAACVGLHTFKWSIYNADSQTESGCLSFLGVCLGLLLMFGESTWELFFFFFGFMRYRLGRACIYIISGMMPATLGKARDRECDCNDNVVLIIEGVALIAIAILQLLAIFLFGNNSSTRYNQELAQRIDLSETTPLPVIVPRQSSKDTTSFQAVIQPPCASFMKAREQVMQASPPAPGGNNLPSWMHSS